MNNAVSPKSAIHEEVTLQIYQIWRILTVFVRLCFCSNVYGSQCASKFRKDNLIALFRPVRTFFERKRKNKCERKVSKIGMQNMEMETMPTPHFSQSSIQKIKNYYWRISTDAKRSDWQIFYRMMPHTH